MLVKKYSEVLRANVSYRQPLFLINLNMVLGGNENHKNDIYNYNMLVKNRELFYEFIKFLNEISKNSNLIIRNIIFHGMNYEILKKYNDFDMKGGTTEYIESILQYQDEDRIIENYPFAEVDGKNLEKYCKTNYKAKLVIIKMFTDSEDAKFIKHFISQMTGMELNYHSKEDIVGAMKGYDLDRQLTSLFTTSQNIIEYLVFEKK